MSTVIGEIKKGDYDGFPKAGFNAPRLNGYLQQQIDKAETLLKIIGSHANVTNLNKDEVT